MVDIFKEVADERERQTLKYGDRDQHPSVWLTILSEEVGEVAKEICDAGFDVEQLSPNYKTELIQMIAVGVAMLENYNSYIAAKKE